MVVSAVGTRLPAGVALVVSHHRIRWVPDDQDSSTIVRVRCLEEKENNQQNLVPPNKTLHSTSKQVKSKDHFCLWRHCKYID